MASLMKSVFMVAAAALMLVDAASVLGGKSPVDSGDELTNLASQAAVKHFDTVGNHMQKHKLHKIVSGTKQVVSGMKYELTLEVHETSCLKDEVDNGQCEPTGKAKHMDVTIWAQPWKLQQPYQVTLKEVRAVEPSA